MGTPASRRYFYASHDCHFVTVLVHYFKGKKKLNNSILLHSVGFCSKCARTVVNVLPEEKLLISLAIFSLMCCRTD